MCGTKSRVNGLGVRVRIADCSYILRVIKLYLLYLKELIGNGIGVCVKCTHMNLKVHRITGKAGTVIFQ